MKQLFAKDKLVKTVGIATAALTLSVVTIIGAVSAQEPTDDGQTGRRGPRGNSELHAYLHSEDVRGQMKSALAEALGVTVEELEAAKENGQSIRELAEAQGVELSEVQEAKKAALIAAIEEAVDEGTITQEQADQMLERIENGNFRKGPRRGRGGNGDGFRGGFSGPRGGNGPANDATTL